MSHSKTELPQLCKHKMPKIEKLANIPEPIEVRAGRFAWQEAVKILLITLSIVVLNFNILNSINMPDCNEKFARDGANFTSDLLNQISSGNFKENVIFSPFSIQACLALAFAGANGETANEIASVMKYGSNVQPDVAKAFQFVLDKYKSSPLLKIANKIYVRNDRKIKDAYQQTLKNQYFAEAEAINFVDNVNAANSINSWVESKTNNKIKDLISASDLDESTRLVLLNALHFKGDWKSKFDINLTSEDDFWLNNNDSIKIQYMQQKAKFNYGYFPELECTVLEMPYKDSDLSMLVVLPNERNGLKAVIEKLKTNNLVDLASKLNQDEVVVKFPKFKIEFSLDLTDVLKRLGLTKVFDNSADFSNMLEPAENLAASKVIHKACIEVNEEGTEAAAATGMIMMMRCLMQPLTFDADHPFLYFIWNRNNILFAGAFVNTPKA